jgi:nucleotide-binding universal stress UspA family protein
MVMKSSKAATATKTSVSLRKMVVAVDLSDHSESTARYAAEIARCFSASLSVVYVYQPVPLGEYVCESTFTILEEERDRLCKLLGELAQKVTTGRLMCKAVFLVGDPAEQIARWARKVDADLIITGSNGPTFLGRLFNLAKAPRIMHRAPCPVLVYNQRRVMGTWQLSKSHGATTGGPGKPNGMMGPIKARLDRLLN